MDQQPTSARRARADQRPPTCPSDRLPRPLRILDDIAAIALSHIARTIDGIRYRHAVQLIPPDELDYHQDEHCLCGPLVEPLPGPVGQARWLVRHYLLLPQGSDDEGE
ncbi:hypothetical protein [Glycomyces tarimensis]